MKKKGRSSNDVYKHLKQLISDIQGAPYPSNVSNELYTIWYEHAQTMATQALEYLNDVNAIRPDED